MTDARTTARPWLRRRDAEPDAGAPTESAPLPAERTAAPLAAPAPAPTPIDAAPSPRTRVRRIKVRSYVIPRADSGPDPEPDPTDPHPTPDSDPDPTDPTAPDSNPDPPDPDPDPADPDPDPAPEPDRAPVKTNRTRTPAPAAGEIRAAADDVTAELLSDPQQRQRVARVAYNGSAAALGHVVGLLPWLRDSLDYYGQHSTENGAIVGAGVIAVCLIAEIKSHNWRGRSAALALRLLGWIARIPLASAVLALALYSPESSL